ncbi:hypothetical protein KP509_21G022200 [Ceratopteris richardii]|uniref:Uncharacterized protein n=1 Tax=Ceratopteris richardii TaxID=49495 RepID=A0A8T2SBD4_CERRI|nr:hypothetical protein KP509_21G022200 [Ceratopteris richardii]
MVFGRKKRQQHHEHVKEKEHTRKKKKMFGKRSAAVAISDSGQGMPCKAGHSCVYPAAAEACLFRAEVAAAATEAAAPQGRRSTSRRSSPWDCQSSLYDSFELGSFSQKLGRSLAEERLRFGSRRRAPVPTTAQWPPRSRRAACFPSCFPKRTPTIQLGKRKVPSLLSAFHVLGRLARSSCHAITKAPIHPSRLPQAEYHLYHHHIHHVTTHERPDQELHGDVDCVTGFEESCGYGYRSIHSEDSAFDLDSRSVDYLPLQGRDDHHMISIKYQC